MNYQVIYDRIIAKYIAQPTDGYSEKHHIIPKCMGGLDGNANIVRLPARVHFVAHLLLARIHGGSLIHAAFMMSNFGKYGSRKYEWVKRKHANQLAKRNLGNVYGNANKGKIGYLRGKKHSACLKQKMANARMGKGLGNKNAVGNVFNLTEEQKAKVSLAAMGNQRTKGMRFKYIDGKKMRIA